MIDLYVVTTVVLLLVLVGLAWKRTRWGASSSKTEQLWQDEALGLEACPREFVARIFSEQDREFVAKARSSELDELFERERRGVAVFWVKQTAAGIRRAMREHADASRQSQDLVFATEAKIALRYAELLGICALLLIVIRLAGPLWLHGSAGWAQQLSGRVGLAQEAFKAALDGQTMGSAEGS
jgi:hypothetical protein